MMPVYSRPLFDAANALSVTLKDSPPADPHVAQAFEALYTVLEKLTDELCTLLEYIQRVDKGLPMRAGQSNKKQQKEFSINEEWRGLYEAEEELRMHLKENPPADPNVAQAFKALLPVLANLTSELYYVKYPFQPQLDASASRQTNVNQKRAYTTRKMVVEYLTDKIADGLFKYWRPNSMDPIRKRNSKFLNSRRP
jgi:hypothetical protein